jgi:hypothetical protein
MKSINQKIKTAFSRLGQGHATVPNDLTGSFAASEERTSVMRKLSFVAIAAILCAALPLPSFGQPLFGVGVTGGTLGAGIQGAMSVTPYSNIRAGFNDFSYSDTFAKDGITYGGTLQLRSAQVTYDQYFKHMGGFHISPGALIYDGNGGTATANISSGQTFTLGNQTYYSSAASPVTGNGAITFAKAAPMVLVGFGNLVPRGERHFGFGVEAGVVFQGSAKAALNLGGMSCLASPTAGCVDTATDPGVQANLQAEQTKLNNQFAPYKYYPVVAMGISYRFGK